MISVPALSMSGAVEGAILGGVVGAAYEFNIQRCEFHIPRWRWLRQNAIEVLGSIVGGIGTQTDIPTPVNTDIPKEIPAVEEVIEDEWRPTEPPPDEEQLQQYKQYNIWRLFLRYYRSISW